MTPVGLLQPLPIPSQVWEELFMDFIRGLPKAQGMDTILVVVDRLTKYSYFIGFSHPYSAKNIVALFKKEIVRLHGFPSTIKIDHDWVFMSSFYFELFKHARTKLKYSSAYQSQTEVLNRCLEAYLRSFIGAKPKQWPRWLC